MPHPAPSRSVAARLGAGALGLAFTGLSLWLAWHNLRRSDSGGWIFWLPVALWLFTMGVLCWWSALGSYEPASRRRVRATWRVAWVVGALALTLGYVGPLVVTPRANLGPLLGILITGPLGFVLGALGGAVFAGGSGRGVGPPI